MKPKRMTKKEALAYWEGLVSRPPEEFMRAIPYKAEGSKFGYDGIRIDGSRPFIDAVLSQLKGILCWESHVTRLELNYTETVNRETNEPTGNWVCYIRAHQRGTEGAIASGFFDKHLTANTEKLERIIG